MEVPELLPARMVNEATYCLRLFYMEWVQSRFVDNTETVDGRFQHRVVDAAGGRAPGPGEIGDFKVARSVLLSSPRLGLVGRVDLVEGDGEEVVPVEYKRGSAPDLEMGAWAPERLSACKWPFWGFSFGTMGIDVHGACFGSSSPASEWMYSSMML